MIDKRYQRKPKKDHPWVGWKPGFFTEADRKLNRQPPPAEEEKVRPSRDEVYLAMARVIATRGTCARRRVGCVVTDEDGFVLATGYNGVAAGRPHCREGHPCPGAQARSGELLDACQAIHAEANAILRLPDPRRAHTVYCTASPCVSCVKLLLGTAAQRIVFHEVYPHGDSQVWWEQDGREWIHFTPEVPLVRVYSNPEL